MFLLQAIAVRVCLSHQSKRLIFESQYDAQIRTVMSMITPTPRSKGPYKGGGRRNDNNRIYANPLPLVFSDPPPSRIRSVLGLLGLSLTEVLNPHIEGIFDATTRSVWVSTPKDTMLLWRRGFFGKGDLSRSEPSWLARQINIRQTGGKRVSICYCSYNVQK